MSSTSVRACLRCHEKKIRCTGYPCRNCSQAQVRCETYIRPRKTDSVRAVKDAQRRTRWLEIELSRRLGVDCCSIPTDTPLQSIGSQHDGLSRNSACGTPQEQPDRPLSDDSPAENNSNAPEISLLALNATGELRYLGPSSGALFANYAIALLGSNVSSSKRNRQHPDGGGSEVILDARVDGDSEQRPLSSKEVQFLLQSYKMWVHPLYPLLDLERLDGLVARCLAAQSTIGAQTGEGHDMGIFYLVMALGATNHANTAKQLRINPSAIGLSDRATSPTYLYAAASRYFLRSAEHLRPSVKFIQMILLVCIYSFYAPIGSSQWQLAGMAMRTAIEMGLHYTPRGSQTRENIEERNRAFWVAYSIEITLAYNLGRPPSISQEHITAQLPTVDSADVALGVHHIKHRQIQSRIVSQVYYGRSRDDSDAVENQQAPIAKLQSELDEWRASLNEICPSAAGNPYPYSYWNRLYHGTTFVLHRASPLCPNPSDESLERCIRSAGAYIDSMADVLRLSNVPLSWMLVQGILFAGLTMLVTARTSYRRLASRAGVPFVLVELAAWSRKCSVCLAVVNERWHEDLLPELGNQFELLTDNTLSVISRELTSQGTTNESLPRAQTTQAGVDMSDVQPAGTQFTGMMPESVMPPVVEPLPTNVPGLPDGSLDSSWDNLDLFRDVLGIDGSLTFWDIFTPETDNSGQGQRLFLG